MSSLVPAYIGAAATLCAVFLGYAVNRFWRPRPRLRYAVSASLDFNIPARRSRRTPASTMRTTRMLLINKGTESARKLEIALTGRPDGVSTSPVRHVTLTKTGGNFILGIESLAAGERLDLEMLSIGKAAAEISAVRCENGTAERMG